MAIVTMTQALKKLYKAVVGEDTTKNNPTKIVSDLADNWSGSGGGSSDFSTAEVTVTNNTDTVIKTWNFPILTEADTIFGEAELHASESNDFEAVMYKGTARCYVCDHSYNTIPAAYVTVTGAIEKITDIEGEDWYCLITGDGTISLP